MPRNGARIAIKWSPLAAHYSKAGVRVSEIEHAVTCAHDRLLVYLLADAEATLGAPPCPYAWIVLGSQGRYEQTLHTDQDNALVYTDDAPPEAEPYFAMLAERIVKQLVECGFPRCPGEILATNPQWRQPLRTWRRYFRHWINVPEEEALLRAAIFFDYRQVYGTLDADRALRPIIDRARTQRLFLGLLARAALRHAPPLGFFQQFITEHSGSAHDLIDLKLRGTAPIVDLARLFALEAGCTATNTLARLRMSTAGGSLNKADAEELAAAFDQISLLRLRYHYDRIRHSEQPTNLVPVYG